MGNFLSVVSENHNAPVKIALWGPPNSGKTWLLHSLNKALSQISYVDQEFSYELVENTDDRGNLVVTTTNPSNVQTTSGMVDIVWTFQRRPKIKNYSHYLSSHCHNMYIHDGNGSDLLNLERHVQISLLNANLILVFLDPTLISSGKVRENALPLLKDTSDTDEINDEIDFDDNADLGGEFNHGGNSRKDVASLNFTEEEYTLLVGQLFSLLAQSTLNQRSIAVCVTKTDLIQSTGSPLEVVRKIFGQEMIRLFDKYANRFHIKLFLTTSVGYINKATGQSNFDQKSGQLINFDAWKPENIESPLFWYLERIERQRILRFSSWFSQFVFKEERSTNYIPYPPPFSF